MTLSVFRKDSSTPRHRTGWVVVVLVLVATLYFVPQTQAAPNNGENANNALGEYDIDNATVLYTKGGVNNGPNRLGFDFSASGGAVAMDSVNHRLFVVDPGNNRLLVYTLDSSNNYSTGRVPANLLGQSSFISNDPRVTQSGMNYPDGVAYDSVNNRLFVTDANSNRVLVFNTSTISNGMNASYVLGQADFVSNGTSVTQSGLSHPNGLAYDSGDSLLYVSDYNSNRVMVFNVAPGTINNGENASHVLGQPSFVSAGSNVTQSGMSHPFGLAYDAGDTLLYVADFFNNRVLGFSVASGTIANGENASYVLGQADFVSNGASVTQSGMHFPSGLAFDSADNWVFVADSNNHRVLAYVTSTITNGMNASYVLEKSNFTTNTAATSQSSTHLPTSLAYDSGNTRLYVSDYNSRVLMFNVAPGSIANGENASDSLGQFDIDNATVVYAKGGANNGPNQIGFNLATSGGIALDSVNHRLFLPDGANNRVLVYKLNTDNSFATNVPAYVLGQPSFISNGASVTQSGMSTPIATAYDGTNNLLYVAEANNNRILVFNTATITNGMNASNVLGQSGFTTSTAATTQSGLSTPIDIVLDSTNQLLYVGESINDRVVMFNVAPGTITNGENASYVLGQSAFTTGTAATTQSGLSQVYGVALDSTNQLLYVGDTTNNRVMVFPTAPTGGPLNGNGENASYVLGQPGFTTSTAATTQSAMNNPMGIATDPTNKRLFVVDANNNRILVFNTTTITNGMNASNVLGQSNFTGAGGFTSQSTLSQPRFVFYNPGSGQLFVTENSNNRITIFNCSALSSNPQSFFLPGYD